MQHYYSRIPSPTKGLISVSLRPTPLSLHHSLSFPSLRLKLKLKASASTPAECQVSNGTPPKPLNWPRLPNLLPPLKSLSLVQPFIQTQYKPILAGWLCSFVAVFSLSKIIPRVGKCSSNLTATKLRSEGLVLGVFVLARLVATYWQQAFLWEAALNAVYEIRVRVFERVLERDLGFFEGGDGVSAGDIAYRITAEANDVADTVYTLLNTTVPSVMQLSAMATQMLLISPALSLISAMSQLIWVKGFVIYLRRHI